MSLIPVKDLIGFDPVYFRVEDPMSTNRFVNSVHTLCSQVCSQSCKQVTIQEVEQQVSKLISQNQLNAAIEVGGAFFGSNSAAMAYVEGLNGKSSSFWSWILCASEQQPNMPFKPSSISKYESQLPQRRDLLRVGYSIEILPSLGILHSMFKTPPQYSSLEEYLGVFDCIANNSCIQIFTHLKYICPLDDFHVIEYNLKFKPEKSFVAIIDDCLTAKIETKAKTIKTDQDEEAFKAQVTAVYRPGQLLMSTIYTTSGKNQEFAILKKIDEASFLVQFYKSGAYAVLQFSKIIDEDLNFTPMKTRIEYAKLATDNSSPKLERMEHYLDTFDGEGVAFTVEGSNQLYVWPGLIVETHNYLDMRSVEPFNKSRVESCQQIQTLTTVLDLYSINLYHTRIFENAKLVNDKDIEIKHVQGSAKTNAGNYFTKLFSGSGTLKCPLMVVSDPSMLREIGEKNQGCLYLMHMRGKLTSQGHAGIESWIEEFDKVFKTSCVEKEDQRQIDERRIKLHSYN
jgi:hypothetical protein